MDFEKVVSFYLKASKYGYVPHFSPAVEWIEKTIDYENFLLDRHGNVFALREDFTKSILNYRAKHMPHASLKVWYSDFVYRYFEGSLLAEYQLGLENIPKRSIEDTFEVLGIVLESISEIFPGNHIVEIGHTGVYDELLSNVPSELHDRVLNLIDAKNLAELNFLAKIEGLDLSLIENLIEDSIYRRTPDNIEIMAISNEVKEDLKRAVNFIEKNFDRFVVEIDLTLARTIENYCGLIFTVYDVDASRIIAAGGEYLINGEKGVGGCIYLEGRKC